MLALAARYGRPYLRWYLAGVVAIVVTNGLSVEVPLWLAAGVDALGAGDRAEALRCAGVVGLLGLLVIAVRTLSRLLFFQPGRFVEAAILKDLLAVALAQDAPFFRTYPPGDLSSRATSDLLAVRLLFGFAALGVVNTAVALLVTLAQLVRMSPVVAALAVVPLAVAMAGTTTAAGSLRTLTRRVQQENAALSQQALATFQGLAALRAAGAVDAAVERFEVHNQRQVDAGIERAKLRIWVGPVLVLATTVDVWIALTWGGPRAVAGDLSAGDLVAFTALVGYLASPLRGFTFTLAALRMAQGSVERVAEVLDAPTNRPERADGRTPQPAPSRPPSLSLRGLGFRHGDGPPALDGVDLEVPAGAVVGIYGATGSGKTTLVRCLLRLDDPPAGAILVDGVDVRSIDLLAWRRTATLVPQRAFLFSESLLDNIGLGERGRDEVLAAATRAQLGPDLAAFPQGLDTVVGEAGLTLSGGQRQRVALARGLLRASTVLVLDDVLSAVDPATERALCAELRDRRDRPTTLLVSNRLSVFEGADVVLVLDRGRRVDLGTHEELVGRPGPYRDAWLAQGAAA